MLVIVQAYPMGVLLQRHLEGLGDAILVPAQALACRGQRVVYFAVCLEPAASPPGPTSVPFTDHWVTMNLSESPHSILSNTAPQVPLSDPG